MNKQQTNYSNEKKKRKPFIIGISILCALILATIGLVSAYFTDFIDDSGSVSLGTLKLNGSYTYSLNGESVSLNEINYLSPGDVIVVKGSISNTGSNSAWVRDVIDFDTADASLLPYLEVYEGELTQSELTAQTDLSALKRELSVEGKAVTGNKVLNGTVENDIASGDYTFLNSTTYTLAVTIYFSHNANNTTQGKIFGLTFTTQALQFKNNNLSEPNETAWSTVIAA